METQ
jgi:hypothetical protein